MAMKKELSHLLFRIKEEIRCYYQKRLVSIAIFGSMGRGTPNNESDIDILIVADGLPKGRMARVKEFEKVEKRLKDDLDGLKHKGISADLSPIFKTKQEVLNGSLLFLDIIDDGAVFFDRGEFLRKYLESLRKKLRKLGAKKISQGDRWYWILKPDYVPGEIFEI